MVSSLRSVGREAITPGPTPPPGPDAVDLVVGSEDKAGTAALQLVREAGIAPTQTWILAASRRRAQALSRVAADSLGGSTAMAALLGALAQLHAPQPVSRRLAAVHQVEGFVLRMLQWPDERSTHTRREQLEHLGISDEQLRAQACRLLSASSDWSDKATCASSVRTLMTEFAAALPISLVDPWGRKAQILETVWDGWQARRTVSAPGEDLREVRHSHIHGVKGEEFEAVILALTSPHNDGALGLDHWESGTASEQRRVLYVGASRAQRHLVLITPTSRQSQVQRVLDAARVRYRVCRAN
ncbi:3'-5' exonuclease [Kineococcus esterisolvens]|uniref:3'-5' exonuclease n=1 Tax=unclassified Kineococcus TaxID=2621656 RepID=UPI003D7CFE70